MIPLAAGSLSAGLAVIIGLLSAVFLNMHFYSLTVWLIAPAGGLLGGMLASSGYFWGLKRAARQVGAVHYTTGALFSLVAFVGVYYAVYIAQSIPPENQKTGFVSFIRNSVGTRHRSFWVGVSRPYPKARQITLHDDTASPAAKKAFALFDWAGFILECLGFIAGGVLTGFLMLSGRRSCPLCGKGYLQSRLFFYGTRQDAGTLEDTIKSLQSKDQFQKWLKDKRAVTGCERINISLCERPDCHYGHITSTASGRRVRLTSSQTSYYKTP
jgi:hypothetical protein